MLHNHLQRPGHVERLLANFGDHVRPEYRELVRRGTPLTYDELKALRGNSWEWRVLYAAADDEAYMRHVEYCIDNCGRSSQIGEHDVAHVYNDDVIGVQAPQLIERLRDAKGLAYSVNPTNAPWTFGPDGGQWVHCSPAFINAGIACGRTPRRPGPEGIGHEHYIAWGPWRTITDISMDVDVAKMFGDRDWYVRHPGGRVEVVKMIGDKIEHQLWDDERVS